MRSLGRVMSHCLLDTVGQLEIKKKTVTENYHTNHATLEISSIQFERHIQKVSLEFLSPTTAHEYIRWLGAEVLYCYTSIAVCLF